MSEFKMAPKTPWEICSVHRGSRIPRITTITPELPMRGKQAQQNGSQIPASAETRAIILLTIYASVGHFGVKISVTVTLRNSKLSPSRTDFVWQIMSELIFSVPHAKRPVLSLDAACEQGLASDRPMMIDALVRIDFPSLGPFAPSWSINRASTRLAVRPTPTSIGS